MDPQTTFSWAEDVLLPFGAVLFGGLLSLAGTWLALRRGHAFDQRRDQSNARRVEAENALAGFHKLMNAHNEIANIKRHIDEAFDDASEAGFGDFRPWAKVKVVIGDDFRDEVLAPGETSFLLRMAKADLLNRAHLIQRRAWNHQATSQKYNEMRNDMDEFLRQNVDEPEVGDGTTVGGFVSGRMAKVAELEEGRLDNFLGQMMHHLEADEEESFQVAKSFKEAASEYFGDLFPTFNFWKANE
jgi:hypothetical protein